MKPNENNINKELKEDSRLIFILLTIFLFVIMILSFNSFTVTYTSYREEILQLPIKYSIPTLLSLLPIILSVTLFIIFIRSLDFYKQSHKDDEEAKNESIFSIILMELRNPTSVRNNRRKKMLITLFILSVLTLIITKSYVIIVVYFVS